MVGNLQHLQRNCPWDRTTGFRRHVPSLFTESQLRLSNCGNMNQQPCKCSDHTCLYFLRMRLGSIVWPSSMQANQPDAPNSPAKSPNSPTDSPTTSQPQPNHNRPTIQPPHPNYAATPTTHSSNQPNQPPDHLIASERPRGPSADAGSAGLHPTALRAARAAAGCLGGLAGRGKEAKRLGMCQHRGGVPLASLQTNHLKSEVWMINVGHGFQ